MMDSQNYSAEAIEILSGLDPVRRRPGMYTDTQNPNHLVREVVDNSVDEAIAGYATCINVELSADGSITVIDDGRGMPVDDHPQRKCSAVEVILTTLHAGGKFSNHSYQFSGGLHGVGISVVNALSSQLTVEIMRHGWLHTMSFVNGEALAPLRKTEKVAKKNTGTRIHFTPDERFFEFAKIDMEALQKYLKIRAVLCPGLTILLHSEATNERLEWCYQSGISAYLTDACADSSMLPDVPFYFSAQNTDSEVEFAIAWSTDGAALLQEGYVNAIATTQGGTHVNGLRAGITDALREFCDFQSLLPRQLKLIPDDVWKLAAFVLAVRMPDPQFVGQVKEKLSSRKAFSLVAQVAKDGFSLWLNQHVETGRLIAELVMGIARARQRRSQKVSRKKIASGPALPGKLTDCLSDDLSQTELFIVEGDSAGGSARQARDKNYQAILPLRGKILNTWEIASDQILSSDEIHDISVAIGMEPSSGALEKLRYGKICILADADSDGLHIATLLCALFVRHFRILVERGYIHVAMPPLYRVDIGKDTWYALDSPERDAIVAKHGSRRSKPVVTRFKGLGEMNPGQLKESTMNPDSRRLVQLSVSEEDNTVSLMDMLLAKKRSGDRRHWLQERGDLAAV